MARVGGSRRKRVGILTKTSRTKGKISQRAYLQEFNPGDKVALVIESSVQQGVFHPRFSGRTGTIVEKKGSVYVVKIRDISKQKNILVHPVHLKRV